MTHPSPECVVDIDPDQQPLLVVIVDTEEEFDWGKPFSRDNTRVSTVRNQARAHRIFERYAVRPLYVIDYPVASQPEGHEPLKDLLTSGCCEIGTHLQPWVNPPFEEKLGTRNSFPCNLPAHLEREKLRVLTDTIQENLGVAPAVYKAGRYGLGSNTPPILAELGYAVDVSVIPHADLRHTCGPDFRLCPPQPYWFGPHDNLLEIPLTVGYTGILASNGASLYRGISRPAAVRWHVPGILSRLGLLERIILTPEGPTHTEHRRLTEVMLAQGHRVFSLTYHSPSLSPGHTPYVRDKQELYVFLDRIERYLDYFVNEIGGRAATPGEVRGVAEALRSSTNEPTTA